MAGHGRLRRRRLAALLTLVGLLALGPAAAAVRAQDARTPPEMLDDAELAGVCFIDPLRGWAVGDRGVILHTTDGGRSWRLQSSPVGCRLESVFFLDAENGWAVGGFAHPYTHKSTGVVLRTRDGGRRWAQVSGRTLPALAAVKFFDTARGWAIGTPSAMYPAGVFRTTDGGRSWSSVPGVAAGAWLAGDFLDPERGIAAGRDGAVARVRSTGVEASRTAGFGLRHLRGARMFGDRFGWLVGDGGLVLTTVDGGISWQRPPALLPRAVSEQFDFTAPAVFREHCWIAGTPGSCVWHTADGGRTWDAFRTGQSLPIRGIAFVDARHGWAVGSLGTILATDDGGATWRRQRTGGTRAAVVGFFSRPTAVPLELFAKLCGNEGYLGMVEILNRRDVEVRADDETAAAERIRDAMVSLGACGAETAWRFPLRQPGLRLSTRQLADVLDRAADGRGLARLEEHVVRKIRQWRPDVIVTEPTANDGGDPLADLVARIVLAAVEKAADSTVYTDQITVAGLGPWRVKRVYTTCPADASATVRLTTAQLAPRLGRSLAGQASIARGLLAGQYEPGPASIGFRLASDRSAAPADRRDFFSGIVLHPGGEARRLLGAATTVDLDRLRLAAQTRRNVEQLLARSEQDAQGGTGWVAQLSDLTRGLDADAAGEVLYHLAQRYARTGHGRLAADTLELLIERRPDHPLVEPALLCLVQYYAGGEVAWRQRTGSRSAVEQVSAVEPVDHGDRPEAAVVTEMKPADRSARAVALGRIIERTRPALFAEPRLRFPLAVAWRRQGLGRQAERYYHLAASAGADSPWSACGEGESWLVHPTGPPPKALWRCASTSAPPRLDGKLDDPVWRGAEPVELKSALRDDARWGAAAMLAHDRRFLYLAVRCKKAPGCDYPTASGPRPRDPDLTGRDRVDLLIDIDRDYTTYYRLTVDYRGFPAEACAGDKTWNPTWYVAAAADEKAWTVEAAIPIDQLTGRQPDEKTVWAVGVQRTAPGVGFQSWTQPASIRVEPEGFGYLWFD